VSLEETKGLFEIGFVGAGFPVGQIEELLILSEHLVSGTSRRMMMLSFLV
jgi:hypothetical protein